MSAEGRRMKRIGSARRHPPYGGICIRGGRYHLPVPLSWWAAGDVSPCGMCTRSCPPCVREGGSRSEPGGLSCIAPASHELFLRNMNSPADMNRLCRVCVYRVFIPPTRNSRESRVILKDTKEIRIAEKTVSEFLHSFIFHSSFSNGRGRHEHSVL